MVLAGCKHVDEMDLVNVQRTSDDDSIDVFAIEQASIIIERIDAGCQLFRFVSAAGVDVSNGDKLRVWYLLHLFEKFLTASADADHPDTHTIVSAKNVGRKSHQGSGSKSSLFHEFASSAVGHLISSELLVHAASQETAVDAEDFSCHKRCRIGSQEHGGAGKFIDFAEPLHGGAQHELLTARASS